MVDLAALGAGATYTRRLVTVGLVREQSSSPGRRLRSAADVYGDFKCLTSLDREAFMVLHLDQRNRVTGVHVVSVGSLSASLVHPREVFKGAILSNAAAVLLVHNHPSGDPSPSVEDRQITARLRACGDVLGIEVRDHVVVAEEGYYSYEEQGWPLGQVLEGLVERLGVALGDLVTRYRGDAGETSWESYPGRERAESVLALVQGQRP